jgi:hypothetical protein
MAKRVGITLAALVLAVYVYEVIAWGSIFLGW